jgi:hypothetical protein
MPPNPWTHDRATRAEIIPLDPGSSLAQSGSCGGG